ncbi:MerR family transcriptional regulator [Paenibacillus tengchongensis]|uniref:MerR family transcriptional regulator n=1 Tax=Paenibacillus tengchongensis TaxID=2608684 RepID=UPI00124E8D1C|nr:MerR family transcriptional regulator [Paenibacillus tengchongensis]
MKKDKLTISQMAKLREIPIDTLRYYDKIGLFNPAHTDTNTGYRYYSILQYEVLGTIMELRRIGLSVEEVRQFMNNRNMNQSIQLLKQTTRRLNEQIAGMQQISTTLEQRIRYIEDFVDTYRESDIVIRELPERHYITLSRTVDMQNPESLSYGILELETIAQESIPLIANNRLGHYIESRQVNALLDERTGPDTSLEVKESEIFLILEQPDSKAGTKTKKVPEGTYVCSYYTGLSNAKCSQTLRSMLLYCRRHHLTVQSGAWNVIQVDLSITDNIDEASYEIQLLVKG